MSDENILAMDWEERIKKAIEELNKCLEILKKTKTFNKDLDDWMDDDYIVFGDFTRHLSNAMKYIESIDYEIEHW